MDNFDTITNILAALIWLIIILVIGISIRNKHKDEAHYRYFIPNLVVKILLSLAFAVYYFRSGGGDTVAYFDGALSLNKLFLKSPSMYFDQLFNGPDVYSYWRQFDSTTGFPPGWIYHEEEAFFISKLLSPIAALAMGSYYAATIIIAFITSQITWKLFQLVRGLKISTERNVAIALLFIPSVGFWCSGISKDTVIYISIVYLVYFGFSRLNKMPLKFSSYLMAGIMIALVLNVRSFVLLIVALPFILAYVSRLLRRAGARNWIVTGVRTLILGGGFAMLSINLSNVSEQELLQSNAFLQEASVVQKDFTNNATYQGKRYDLGTIEYTFGGLLRVAPAAIFAGTFRPVIWEALSPTLILNGLESIFLLFALIRFLSSRPFTKYAYIRRNEFLFFCLVFVLLLAFITGLTSILFGVLVRMRAPLLPFLILLLVSDYSIVVNKERQKESKKSPKLT